jgi:hypothetical protein
VEGSSPSDVWAVGYDRSDENRHRTLVLHWDGRQWEIVPSPDPGGEGSQLMDVAAVSPTEAWAVGSSTVEWPLLGETLALRWDGESWARVPSPNPSQSGVGSNLHSVDVGPDGRAWAGGAIDQGDLVMGTMVMRWDDGAWSLVPTPNDPAGSLAGAVSAADPGNVWAVGWRQGDHQETLALRRHRGRWTATAVATPPGVDAALSDVTVAGGDAWVVGSQGTSTLAARWHGRSWTVVPSVDPGTVASAFAAVTAVPRTGCLWAVGQYTDGDRGRALIERYCPG